MSLSKRSVPAPRVMNDLLSARLHALANLSSATTTLRVERKFGLTLLEWRSLGQLGGFAPLSLKELARRAGFEKSYASRTISGLIERGLVASERSDSDGRGVMLSLTAKGKALYEKAFEDAVARNERLLGTLKDEQRLLLIEILGVLTVNAKRALEDERNGMGDDGDGDSPAPAKKARAKDNKDTADGSLDLVEMRYLLSRLNELAGMR